MKKILLIDGSSLIFRAFYAIRNLTTKDGVFVNGVYGFLNMYYKALELIQKLLDIMSLQIIRELVIMLLMK